jgi:hypothetical protein
MLWDEGKDFDLGIINFQPPFTQPTKIYCDGQEKTWVARFVLVQNTKTGKNIPNYLELYKMSINYHKRPKMDQLSIKYAILFLCKTLKSWIFGLKTNHLATRENTLQSRVTRWGELLPFGGGVILTFYFGK